MCIIISGDNLMLNDLVKNEVSKINDTLDNYQRGRYSRTRAEDRIFESAQMILTEISKKGLKNRVPDDWLTKEK